MRVSTIQALNRDALGTLFLSTITASMAHIKPKGFNLMLHRFGEQLTKGAALSIADVYGLPGSIVDEIERNHPGRSLIKALKQKDIISEDQNILKQFHGTLKQMNYIDLTNIIEDEYPQLKQGPLKDRQASDNSETPVTSNHPRLDSTAPPGGITEDEEPLVSSENEEATPVSFQTSDAPATPLATSPPGSNLTAPTEETVDKGKQMTSQTNIQAVTLELKMDFYLKKVLRKCMNDMEEDLDPMDVIDELIAHKILSSKDKRKLESIARQDNRVRHLISTLEESKGNAFHVFIDALKKFDTYQDIVEALESREKSAKGEWVENIRDIFTCVGENEPFTFCEMLCNMAETTSKREAEKLSTCYKFSVEEKKSVQSKNPGFEVMKLLLQKGILTAADVGTLESDLSKLKLTNLTESLQIYKECLELPVLVLKVKCSPQYLASKRDKFVFFEVGRSLSSLFKAQYDAVYEDLTQQKTVRLRIPHLKSLKDVSKSVQSGMLAKQLMPILMTKQFQENVDVLQVECDEESYKRVQDHFLKDAMGQFQTYLKKVGLSEQYPEKMTLKMATKIRILDKYVPNMKTTDIPLLFLNMLTSLDRRVLFYEKLKFSNVRDFVYALLHCSDDFLRQHILEKIAACQLAVSIVIPSPTGGAPIFLLWALRRVVKKWKDDENLLTPERNVITVPLFTVAFLRIGKLPISKSHILNHMFGRAQSNSSSAYFISKREDCLDDAHFSKGSIEAHWYVPLKGKNGEILDEVTLFLNLRGDANDFPQQVTFVSKVANIVFILVDKTYESENMGVLVHNIKRLSSNVVTVSLKVRLENSQTSSKLTETTNSRIEYEVDGEDIVLSTKLCEIIKWKCKSFTSEDYKCIEDWSEDFVSHDIEITVDEHNQRFKNAFQKSEEAFQNMKSLTVQHIKDKHMYLQELGLKWVECDQKRPTKYVNCTIEIQKDNIRKEKSNIRNKQFSLGLTPEMLTFHNTLRDFTIGKEKDLLHYFMHYFQAGIDKVVKKEIPSHVTKIITLENEFNVNKLKLSKEKVQRERRVLESEIEKLQKAIRFESKAYYLKHMGFEHFMRELCQLFEAQVLNQSSNLETPNLIASLAARLLIEGYPLEILDGDSTYISITWISSIFDIIDKILLSPKVFVVSVIGGQSSGKSTLLNCMFGVRFTVRAGRCTRGLFLQMLEVDDALHDALGFQYLLIIDTEGLQSPDRTAKNDFKFDNTLATLAMCVVDLSILNISQETIGSDMIGIMQIAAHALIRMRKVKLWSRFRIIHQRVSDVNAAGENKSNMNVIKEALDKAAIAAAEEENITGIKEFSDVFPFTENDSLYVPCLWMGNMSPPNHEYSETILNLKTQILSREGCTGNSITQFTLNKFKKRLEDVWDALKKEDFVFNFQNSFNALSYQQFRLEHNKWVAIMRNSMVEWELDNKENVKEGNIDGYRRDLNEEIKRNLKKVVDEIDEYVKTHSDEEEVVRQHNEFKISSKNIANEIQDTIIESFKYYMETRKEKASLPQFIKTCEQMLREKAKQKAIEVRKQDPNLDPKSRKGSLDQIFQTLWQNTSEKLKKDYEDMKVTQDSIISACEKSLITLIDKTKYSSRFQSIISTREEKSHPTGKSTDVQRQPTNDEKGLFRVTFKISLKSHNNDRDLDIQQQIDKICNEEIATFNTDERFEAFDKNQIDKFFTTLLEKLREHMKLSKDYALEALLETCDHIVDSSIRKQRQYEENFSLYKRIEEKKDGLKDDFFLFFGDTIKTEKIAARTFSDILPKISEKLIDHMNVEFLDRIKEYKYFTDRDSLIGTILLDLCESGDNKKYFEFISSQNIFISGWLQDKIVDEVTKNDETDSQLWIEKVALEKLEKFKTTIKDCLNETEKHIEDKLRKKDNHNSTSADVELQKSKHKEHSISFSDWQNVFVEKCKNKKLVIDLQPAMFDSVHCRRLTETLLEMTEKTSLNDEKMYPTLALCKEKSLAKTLVSQMKKNPLKIVLKQVEGCQEVCPFCKVSCDLQGVHSKHTSNIHRSQGLRGFRDIESKELATDICTSLVASNLNYKFLPTGKLRPYKKYHKEFKTWLIKPAKGEEPDKYWQWVMANFHKFFAEQYKAEPAKIPTGWQELSKGEAIASLKAAYHFD